MGKLSGRVLRVAVVVGILALAVPLLLPAAEAQPAVNLKPPEQVTGTIYRSIERAVNGEQYYVLDMYVNWTRSPSHNATTAYNLTLDFAGGSSPSLAFFANETCTGGDSFGVSNVGEIADRPGWCFARISAQFQVSVASRGALNFSWDLWAYEWTNQVESPSACQAQIDARQAQTLAGTQSIRDYSSGWAQCGTDGYIPAPPLSGVSVTDALSSSSGESVVRFDHEPDDPNASTSGDYRYDVLGQFVTDAQSVDQGTCTFWQWLSTDCGGLVGRDLPDLTSPSTTVPIAYTDPPGGGGSGERAVTVSYAGAGPSAISFAVRATDFRTGVHGDFTCSTTIDPNVAGTSYRCGVHVNPDAGVSLPAPIEPHFPFVNMTDFSNVFAVSEEAGGFVLGGLLVLVVAGALAPWGFPASAVGAAAASSVGYAFGVVPGWFLVLGFAAVAFALASRFFGRGG